MPLARSCWSWYDSRVLKRTVLRFISSRVTVIVFMVTPHGIARYTAARGVISS